MDEMDDLDDRDVWDDWDELGPFSWAVNGELHDAAKAGDFARMTALIRAGADGMCDAPTWHFQFGPLSFTGSSTSVVRYRF